MFGSPDQLRVVVVTMCCLAAGLRSAGAQTNERIYENIEFRVVTPGARAVAMGKAFVGLADDATAAASNPAGLSNLFDPEVSVEWSATQLHERRMSSAVPGSAPQTLAFSSWVQAPTFFSFVTPLPDRSAIRNVTLAVFYNSLQHYESHFDIPNQIGTLRLTEGGYAGDINIRAQAFGVGGAMLLGRRVSVGGALTIRRLTNVTAGGGYDEPTRAPFKSGTMTDDRDTRAGGQIGVLVKAGSGVSIGASYLAGTSFQLTTQIFGKFNPDNEPPARPHDIPLTLVQLGVDPRQPIEYRIPDRLTVGSGVRVTPNVTVVGDASLVRYSQRITEKFLIVDFLAQPKTARLDWTQYFLDDVVELHLGGEYRRPTAFGTLAWRAGYFTDPPHQMLFDPDRTNPSAPADGQRRRFNSYQPGTAHGVAIGAGVVLKNRFQFDAALSRSRNALELVVSSVVRFPR